MDSASLDLLLKQGIAGALFVVVTVPLALYARHLAANLKEVQDRRALDAQQVVDKLLGLNDKWNTTVGDNTKILITINSTLVDVKAALTILGDVESKVAALNERFSEHVRRTESVETEIREMSTALRALIEALRSK